MKEIINISLSHKANHLNTHFYNFQEDFLDYNPSSSQKSSTNDADLNVYNNPIISPDKRSVSYSPRLMLWDMRNGFGALDEAETYNESLTKTSQTIYNTYGIETWNNNQAVQQIKINDNKKQKKSDYQEALDKMNLAPKLTPQNTMYWSDYSRMIYSPKSFNTLKNWEIDPVHYPKGKLKYLPHDSPAQKPFNDFDLGVDEWKQNGFNVDYLDTKFRYLLEQCDNLSGINITTECDSGWGGISHEMIPLLKDEFLSKNTIFSWGLYDNSPMKNAQQVVTRIRSILALVENSSIFLPISMPESLPSSFFGDNKALEAKFCGSMWYETALQSVAYETVMSLFANKHKEGGQDIYSMSELEMGLNMGTNRNIVSSIASSFGSMNDYIDNSFTTLDFSGKAFDLKSTGKSDHIFAKNLVIRPPSVTNDEIFDESLIIDNFGKFTDLNRNHGVSLRGLTSYSNQLAFRTPDTFPAEHIPINPRDHSVSVALTVSTKAKRVLLNYKRKLGTLLRKNSDEKEDLVDKLATLAQEYEYGWDSDDDDFDDYY
ncbi:Dml1 protein [Saccharomycopsis crataegensis]|uniref:Protein DML1 n=1 Tax=Saccharomycopsis crataegensis TaxID=43959 RepID=A0AAV5QJA4_9ASCO|nr:Dml1 protein [Saccharomycopsis crataegensis]